MTEKMGIYEDFISSAQNADWQKIDEQLVPLLKDADGNDLAVKFLENAHDDNPDVRDAVATAFAVLNVTDRGISLRIADAMEQMALSDTEKFPAGRAAIYLWEHKEGELKDRFSTAIDKFKTRREIPEWQQELIENVPGMDELLK